MLLLLAGCWLLSPPTVPQCSDYKRDLDAYAACATKAAAEQATTADARHICEVLPPDRQADCRRGWVRTHAAYAHKSDRPDHIAMCAGDNDCLLILGEAWAATDPVEQVGLCRQLGVRYADDCVGHALDRWMRESPDPAEVARVVAGAPGEAKVGYWLGTYAYCKGKTVDVNDPAAAAALDCPFPGLQTECVRGYRDSLAHGFACGEHARPLGDPSQTSAPMPTNPPPAGPPPGTTAAPPPPPP